MRTLVLAERADSPRRGNAPRDLPRRSEPVQAAGELDRPGRGHLAHPLPDRRRPARRALEPDGDRENRSSGPAQPQRGCRTDGLQRASPLERPASAPDAVGRRLRGRCRSGFIGQIASTEDWRACGRTHRVIDFDPFGPKLGLGLLSRLEQLFLGPVAEVVPEDALGLVLRQAVVGGRLVKVLEKPIASAVCQKHEIGGDRRCSP
jgi:hypothetical protein